MLPMKNPSSPRLVCDWNPPPAVGGRPVIKMYTPPPHGHMQSRAGSGGLDGRCDSLSDEADAQTGSPFPSDLFGGICKVPGFHQGNQLERALVECLTIPPRLPGRWRSLLVNIISVAVVFGGAAFYWIRAKAYKIPFGAGEVIFPTSVISERLISDAAACSSRQEHGGLFIRAGLRRDQEGSRKLSEAESRHSGARDPVAGPALATS